MRTLIPIWKKAPFIRIIIPFIAGLIIGRYTAIPIAIAWITLLVAVSFSLFYNLVNSKNRFLLRSFQGICIHTIWLAGGMLALFYQDPRNDESWIGNQDPNYPVYRIKISESLSERPSTFKSTGKILSAYYQDSSTQKISAGKTVKDSTVTIIPKGINGTVLIYFRKDSSINRIKNGTIIYVKKAPEQVPNSSNPGGFNYKTFLELKGIHHQYFLSQAEYIIDTTATIPIATRWLESLKIKILETLDRYIPGTMESGLAKALLVGYKEDLNHEFLDMYSKTGVIHVIAISGLHLAVIYIILGRLFGIISGNRKKISVIPVIFGLWIFTLLAGAGASVCRSALMFTIIAIGESGKKKSNILNSLAASAFILVLYDPFWLWDLGFQLSYAAVLSLVLTQKAIYDIMYISNRLLDELWKMSSVTISAQILTIPILLFNFHQFPVYFLFTNLVCVPVSSLALILELFLCAVFYIEPLAILTGKLISWLLGIMTDVVTYFHQMPFASYGPIQISWVQTVLFYIFIISIFSMLKYRHKASFHGALWAILIFSVLRSFSFYKHSNQLLLIIYNIPGSRAISIVEGRHLTLVTDSLIAGDQKKFERYILPSLIKFRIRDYSISVAGKWNYAVNGNGTQLYVLNQVAFREKDDNNRSGDTDRGKKNILLVGGYRSFKVDDLLRKYNAELLVTDGTVSRKLITHLKEQASGIRRFGKKQADIELMRKKFNSFPETGNRQEIEAWYHTGEKGAFVMMLN